MVHAGTCICWQALATHITQIPFNFIRHNIDTVVTWQRSLKFVCSGCCALYVASYEATFVCILNDDVE